MFGWLARVLGFLPKGRGKTGAREAGTAAVVVPILFWIQAIVVGIYWGREYFDMQLPLLISSMAGGGGAFLYAFKLKKDRVAATEMEPESHDYGGQG